MLALGLLVDDSIVVTENIARHLRSGLTPRDAALEGVKEINVAVVGCTAALLLAFVPLLNLPEAAGDFTRSLPMAVVCTIAASLFVALSVIPFLASRLLPRKNHGNVFLDVIMSGIHAVYRPILHIALSFPRITIAIGLALFAATLTLVPKLGFSLFPENDSPYFLVRVELPQGVSVTETDRAVQFADGVLEDGGSIVCLIKPQFEVGRGEVGKGGIVRDPALHQRVCDEVRSWLEGAGWIVDGIVTSPITGTEGNVEFLISAHRIEV